MGKRFFDLKMITTYILIFLLFLSFTLIGNHGVTVFSDKMNDEVTVMIDAGHGGVDSGAVSCTGAYESQINLQVAKILDDLMHLLGMKTIMIRDTDKSIYTEGDTIAAKKVSDIRNRVALVNGTPKAFLISIHQNQFSDSRYSGAQVFYAKDEVSKLLATQLQRGLVDCLNTGSKRMAKQARGIYLMEKITNPGVLIECGFLSNIKEEALLRDAQYQKKLCAVIGATLSTYWAGE